MGEICDEAVRRARCDGAAVAVLTRRANTRELMYATDALATRLDELQYTLGEGPCLDAYLDDATQTSCWPTFATEATRLGVQSLYAFPIPIPIPNPGPRRPWGALEFYRRTAGSFTEPQHAAAVHAATAITARLHANWEEYLTRFRSPEEAIDAASTTGAGLHDAADPFTHSQIHVAAGMLADRLGVRPTDAVGRLRAHAYTTGRRLSTIAADVIAGRSTLHDHTEPPPP